tara:strand:+ start:117 stop:353 length:237 start_codon:yes stop_codon:yes gene_type:complete
MNTIIDAYGNERKYKIITDGRTLRSFINKGFINEPKYGAYPQVDATFDQFFRGFEYKDKKYIIKYFDGSLYPFVCEII